MFRKVSADAVMGVFTKAINDLREVSKNNREDAQKAIEEMERQDNIRAAALFEAKRAEAMTERLVSLVDDSTVRGI